MTWTKSFRIDNCCGTKQSQLFELCRIDPGSCECARKKSIEVIESTINLLVSITGLDSYCVGFYFDFYFFFDFQECITDTLTLNALSEAFVTAVACRVPFSSPSSGKTEPRPGPWIRSPRWNLPMHDSIILMYLIPLRIPKCTLNLLVTCFLSK